MYLSDAGGRTVATDLDVMFAGVDNALLDAARLSASVLETKATSTLAPVTFQKVLDSMAASFTKIVDGRKSMVAMHRQLAAIKGQSNLAEVDYGCFFATGSAENGANDAVTEQQHTMA
jgi:hypothetical protein